MKYCVVISVYNGSKYIIEQLESIRNQSVAPDAVFIADDWSKDDTFNIVDEYILNNNLTNWHIKKNVKNLGWQISFANLIKNVPEEYDAIFLCDQDDIWYKNKAEEMMKYYEKYRPGILAANVKVQYEDKDAKKWIQKKLGNKLCDIMPILPNNLSIRRPGCILLIDREFSQEAFNNYYEDGLAHDMFLWMYAFCRRNIYYLNEDLMIFRRFSSSSTFMKKGQNRYKHKVRESKDNIRYLKICKSIKGNDEKINKILDNAIELENRRQKFFQTRNMFVWLSCLRFITYYTNYRMWIGDLYFSLLSKE